MFFTNWVGADVVNRSPILHRRQRHQGGCSVGGKRQDRTVERRLCASSSPEEQKKIAADIQKEAYDQVNTSRSGNTSRRARGENR